ncbi:ArsR/SmtB family transcription factor [Algisphaera agarilytica]|uniref:ArsR family transcriptional regulator n=1 Tax=Algisphaera agarilytica TaxID=1385975 RepID=A0A7X0H3Q3_9BACT|nr:ArsR family transcriptional regulator [Algisphaera agarilytica]MBB6428723.1 ArsR family transcriptional regulator [Algisphaera agarilytica]
MNRTDTQPDAMLRWLATLADATRVRLLRLLDRQELGVSDLCSVVQLPQSTVSRHLKVLADEDWLISRRQATTNLYRMVLDELDPAQRDLWVLTRDRVADWPTLAQDEVRLAARLAERAGDSSAFFDDAASGWDKTRTELYGDSFGYEALLALLPSDWTVADFGCGTGQLASALAPNVQNVVGIDNSSAMLKAAAAQTRGHDNVELKQGQLTNVPLEDASCDAVLCVLVLTYLDDPAAVIAEMHRVLKPGGKAVVVDLMLHDREDFRRSLGQRSMGFTPDSLTQILSDAGFSNADARSLKPAPEAKGPTLLLGHATR